MSDSLNPATADDTTAGFVDPAAPPRLVSTYTAGGHEIDFLPQNQLLAMVAGMVFILVLSGVGVYQYFNLHVSESVRAANVDAGARINAKRAALAAKAEAWAEVDPEAGVWRMPASEAARRVIANPALLRAAPAPEGFVHPDDMGKEDAKPAQEAPPAEVVPEPAAPAEGAVAPAEEPPAPAEGAAPTEGEAAPAEGDAP
ncbi:MAG: hypothetical protein H6744_16590 [Deltaproteobacteria bacterium]|nr:hypothetical protein [Deltaproteobacteria bacterium]MCB9788299.1 hypothetical protein [Deltaproteobacteria bacterium]